MVFLQGERSFKDSRDLYILNNLAASKPGLVNYRSFWLCIVTNPYGRTRVLELGTEVMSFSDCIFFFLTKHGGELYQRTAEYLVTAPS